VAIYEFPFNERIRTLLRLEDLFSKVLLNTASEHPSQHHNGMVSFFQILDILDRSDLKADLLHELDRQKVVLTSLVGNPNIASEVLQPILDKIIGTSARLRTISTRIGQPLKENEWLMSIKQRAVIPGGLCEFDLPSYHYWLESPAEDRKQDLQKWLGHVTPIYDALAIILNILRGSGKGVESIAVNGAYQQMLGTSKPAQMLQVKVDDELNCYPEISANKYAINLRFISMSRTEKPHPSESDVPFSLTLGNL
jgi:cell division protein ZapD